MIKVLVAPLDWGLGHATRCIPIIRELLLRRCSVYLAGSGEALALLTTEFPDLASFKLTAYRPVYSSKNNMLLKMAMQLGKFVQVIKQEHQQIERIVLEHKIDLIISDNRYGCWSGKIPCVFITHQLNILMPTSIRWLEKGINYINAKLISRFTVCWIPDDSNPQKNLSGELSTYSRKLKHVDYIGPLSRLCFVKDKDIQYDILFILSGPEPQRSIFEEIAAEQLEKSGLRYYTVRGVFPNKPSPLNGFHTTEQLQYLISRSAVILARSGYSTIMDLAAVGKKAILVPTPGQTEQEYLAKRWHAKKVFYTVSQRDFDLQEAWVRVKDFSGYNVASQKLPSRLQSSLDKVLSVASQFPRRVEV